MYQRNHAGNRKMTAVDTGPVDGTKKHKKKSTPDKKTQDMSHNVPSSRTTMADNPIQPTTTESNPQDPSVLNVTVAVNYITPELEQFVRIDASATPSSSRLDGRSSGGTAAFVPARPTDSVRTPLSSSTAATAGAAAALAPKTPQRRGEAGDDDDAAAEGQGEGDDGQQLARCVSDEAIGGQQQQQQAAQTSTAAASSGGTTENTNRRRRTRRKITPKKIALEKQLVRYSLAMVPEAGRNPDFLHRWRVGEQHLHARLKRRDLLAESSGAAAAAAAAVGAIGSGASRAGSTAAGAAAAAAARSKPRRDAHGRFVSSPPSRSTDKPSPAAASAAAAVSKPPPPRTITTSSGRTVRRRLSSSDDGSSFANFTTIQPPQNGLNDHPRLISDEPAPHIGPGWTIRVVGRPGYDDPGRRGKARYDKYYFSPDGKRFKSMAEVNKFKHDMERERGVDVAPGFPKPRRTSSRLQKKGEEESSTGPAAAAAAEAEAEPMAASSSKSTSTASSSTTSGNMSDDADPTAAATATAATSKDPASCATCEHFPFCSRASPSAKTPGGKRAEVEQEPFLGNDSVIWVPSTRSQWDDCVDEMTAVCYSAALRKYHQQVLDAEGGGGGGRGASGNRKPGGASGSGGKDGKDKGKGKQLKPPHKPLSRDYIRDRIDIDDPIRGYQIRHRTGGWLQGFVLSTTFTTWTHYFKWDSTHPKSGIHGSAVARAAASAGMVGMDHDGSLSAQLEAQPRSGDPNHSGVVWPTIAEISLVGALGCGEYLVRMALDDICRRDCYDYVVLQATDTSRTFYERFGFVRVGAVSKYGRQARQTTSTGGAAAVASSADGVPRQDSQPTAEASLASAPLVGYRHWTYADETSQSISKWHGGPSYMMALKIDRSKLNPNAAGHHCVECGRAVGKVSFLDALADCFVHEKPKVLNLGGTLGRRKPAHSWGAPPINASLAAGSTGGRKRAQDSESEGHRNKRARVDDPRRGRPVTPVGGITEFERRQLNDPWLAVKPLAKPGGKRKPPRSRGERTSSRKAGGRGTATALSFEVETKSKSQKQSKPSSTKRVPLRKQRIPPMYRDPKKVYYYNKVIKPKKKTKKSAPYYFVLHYDEDARTIRIIPLEDVGTFIGRREGRVKWKATVLPRPEPLPGSTPEEEDERYYDSMGVFTASCDDYTIVHADSVHKCAGVKEDSWDIFD